MSRIGKLPIGVPKGVEVKIAQTSVSVKGPKGSLSIDHSGRVDVKLDNGQVHVARFDDSRSSRAYHGLYQRLITNMVHGVTEGFKKELELQGVGYKAAVEGKDLVLNVGYSHPVRFPIPEGVKISASKPTALTVEGFDKQQVGQVAAEIRATRPPEPYKGKGIRYAGERVKQKEGKKGAK